MITFLAHHGRIAVPLSVVFIIGYTYLVLRTGYLWGMRELEFRKLNFGPNTLAQHRGARARRKKRPAWAGSLPAPALAALRYIVTFAWLRNFAVWARDRIVALNADDDDEEPIFGCLDEFAGYLSGTERLHARTDGKHADD